MTIPSKLIPEARAFGYDGNDFDCFNKWLMWKHNINIDVQRFPCTREDRGYYAYVRRYDKGMAKLYTVEATTRTEAIFKGIKRAISI